MTVHALIFEKYPKQKALLWFSVKNDLIYVRGEDGSPGYSQNNLETVLPSH